MALVKNGTKDQVKEASKDSNNAFDEQYNPGDTCKHEGIYKCKGCGKEITLAKDKTFPPQNHHQHSQQQGSIRWNLFVYAQ